MKHIFFALLFLCLLFILPAYLVLFAVVIYVLTQAISPWWIFFFGVLVDSIYGYRFELFYFIVPLYSIITLALSLSLSRISGYLSFSK